MTHYVVTASHWMQDAITGLGDLFSDWRKARARKAMARKTYNALSELTDHELKDLGIGRSDIPSIAYGTFNDKRMDVSKTTANKNLKGWV